MWAPWRYEYIRNLSEEVNEASRAGQSEGESTNFIASYFQTPERDEANFVIHRNNDGIVFLNRYPFRKF